MLLDDVPAVDFPLPAAQVPQGAQDVALFVPALKAPAPQAVQVSSAVLLADVVRYSPAGHVVFFATHDARAFTPILNVFVPQAVHVASAVLFADVVRYSPAGHVVFFAAHEARAFTPILNVFALHNVHVASADAFPEVKYSPGGQLFVRTVQGP